MQRRIILVCLLPTVFLVPTASLAAEIYFGAQSPRIQTGQRFEVGVFINTNGDIVNAVEAKIVYPLELVDVKEIRDGGSIVNLWLQRPQRSAASKGEVAFAGVLPGGYAGSRGLLLSLVLEAKQPGAIVLDARDEQVLRHDGEGTVLAVTRAPVTFTVEAATTTPPELLPPFDSDPPEPFVPFVTKLDGAFDGKYVVIFATQDKGSGIQHYAVAEKRLLPWQRADDFSRLSWVVADSPFALRDQTLQSAVFVKAVDLSGNERVATVAPARIVPWYQNYLVWGIILLIVGITILALIYKYAHGGRSRSRP